jgi:hypothetical protein
MTSSVGSSLCTKAVFSDECKQACVYSKLCVQYGDVCIAWC